MLSIRCWNQHEINLRPVVNIEIGIMDTCSHHYYNLGCIFVAICGYTNKW